MPLVPDSATFDLYPNRQWLPGWCSNRRAKALDLEQHCALVFDPEACARPARAEGDHRDPQQYMRAELRTSSREAQTGANATADTMPSADSTPKRMHRSGTPRVSPTVDGCPRMAERWTVQFACTESKAGSRRSSSHYGLGLN